MFSIKRGNYVQSFYCYNFIWALRQIIERQFIERQFIEPTVHRTDSFSNRQFIEPTFYRTDILFKRQFIETTVCRNDLSELTVARHYYGVVITL